MYFTRFYRQLIGQRSSSVLGNEQQAAASSSQGENTGERTSRHRHHRRHNRTASGNNGYGHINEELIFIERGEHSPHRQEPPAGYEYKGKIEVQNFDKETISRSQDRSIGAPTTGAGPCPPGWQQMVMTGAGACGPCPPGAVSYSGQLVGGGGIGGFTAGGGIGGFTAGGGFGGGAGYGGSFGAGGLPSNCQMVADYIFGSGSAGNIGGGTSGGQS